MQAAMEHLRFGRAAWIAAATLLLATLSFSFTARTTGGWLVWSDGLAYFLYARSAVVDLDLDLRNDIAHVVDMHPADPKTLEPLLKWTRVSEDGSVHLPWPVGAGLVLVPFYAAGYLVESARAAHLDAAPDSYGLIPQYGFAYGSVAFGLIGVWALIRLTSLLVRPVAAQVASWAVVLSGPVVFYVLAHPSMAHASSFGLLALATLLWLRSWLGGVTNGRLVSLGLLVGIAVTVRYQNALFAILPLALVLKDLRERGVRRAAGPAIIAAVLAAAAPLMLIGPHLHSTLSPDSSTVTTAGYPVDLTSPYFFDVLFSCRHGAFHWAPLFGVATLGLPLLIARKQSAMAITLVLLLLANVYLIGGLGLSTQAYSGGRTTGDWLTHWDQAPSFGMRYLTECAPIFAIGLALLLDRARKRITLASCALALFALWNALLMLAYGLQTITRSGCLSYADAVRGALAALARLHTIF